MIQPAPEGPRLLQAESDWNPDETLRLRRIPNPLVSMTLGSVGQAVRVSGPEEFPPTILVLPVSSEQLTGIEPIAIRVFRVQRRSKAATVHWSSGFSPGLGFVWARIQQPGVYVAIGLPRDRLVREVLKEMATRRRREPERPAQQMHAMARSVLSPLVDAPADEVEAVREAFARAEAASADPTSLADIRFGTRGTIQPFPLPGNESLDAVRERLARLETLASGLLEEALFFPPEPPAETEAPWPAIAGVGASLIARVLPDRTAAPALLDQLEPAAAFGVAAPVSANWWMYHHDAQHSGIVTDSHINRLNIGRLRLRAVVPLPGPPIAVPAVVDGKIYIGTGNSRLAVAGSGGTLCKVDLITGLVERIFTFNTPIGQGARQGMAGIGCSPAVADGRVYFSGLDGQLYCLDAETLMPRWVTNLRRADPRHNQPVTHMVNAEGWSSPLVVNGRVYVGWGESESNTFGFVYCLDADTGDVLWLFCTNLFDGAGDNEPNVIPRTTVGMPLPGQFTAHADPPNRGASPWSSAAYDPVSDRIHIGTGNVFPPELVLPQPKYNLGLLSLDAATGRSPRFFQPAPQDSYRRDDSDVDVPPGPTVFAQGNRRVVAIGGKNGSFFLLDADTLAVLARRQLLPRAGGNGGFPGDNGVPLPAVDPHPAQPHGGRRTENFYGIFSSAAVHYPLRRLFVGVGGFAFGIGTPGIDTQSTAFLRALNWDDLRDAWATVVGPDRVRRYVTTRPPMYTTPGEAGFASPAVVNDVVLMTTSRPGMYAFDAETGLGLWGAPGFGLPVPNSFTLGPAVYGDFVVVGSANIGLLIYSL